ncbi:GH10806 [Drosophila grimshawi]|uniref:GH10806 n=1 Tax=Drosophila grimshawi TaxID=7222 RepID=B4JAZ8_DROGR|nr:GH10806 [Drosophila grimshawi]
MELTTMLDMANAVDVSRIKMEAVDCNAAAAVAAAPLHILPEQLNWQLAQSSTAAECIKMEQDPRVIWQSSEAMASCQMQQEAEVQDSNAKPGAISATCNACHSRIKGFVTVTSNFIKHLRLKHFEIHAAFISAKQVGNTETLEVHETESFDHRVMSYIIDSAAPLSTVEEHSFRNMFKGTNLRVMSRSKLELRLDARFGQMCESIKNVIATHKYVCTSADIWSHRHCSYFAYTCHWLDQKYQRKSTALACRRFTGDYAQIVEMMSSINTEYDLNNLKIVATVTHNGSNFAKVFREFGIQNDNSYDDESDCCHADVDAASKVLAYNTLPNHIQCASHTLNLLASSDFVQLLGEDKALRERHSKVFAKCSALWRKCNCPKSAEIIQTVLSGGALIAPISSRWNSIYDGICYILSHKEKLAELCSKLALHNSCFSAGDIQYLEEYRTLMAPIASTIEFLQMETNLYYGCLIPALTSLCVKLKRISDSSDLIDLRNVALELQLRLKQRFAKYVRLAEDANSAIIASVLCPTVKMRWFNALAKVSPHERSADDIHKMIIAEAVRHAKATENNYQVCQESAHSKEKDDFYEFDEIDDACETSDLDMSQPSPLPPTTKLVDDVEAQFHSYLRDSGKFFEVLDKYPLLHDLAIKYNTPLASSAPVERVLSLVNVNRYARRSDLSDYSVEKLVLLKANCTD